MTQIKERPILFSAPMVRAILEGRKTVTRRAVKIQPRSKADIGSYGLGQPFIRHPDVTKRNPECPYGRPGDRLWVRETTEADEDTAECAILSRYVADHAPVLYSGCEDPEYNGTWAHWDYPRQSRPSIHMPRWASRILLEIIDVRVERLKDISDEQAQAEGCFFTDYGKQCFHGGHGWKDVGDCPAVAGHQQREGWMWDKTTSHEQCLGSARHAFGNLWNKVNGPDAWDANPWVWVVEFKRVTP
ncbi:hypothetical protein [Pseudomonas sp. 7SR1]|uniref:hypothetical protein n=1 Tax=Pseudomonas sp. 7SR1 TaxID=1881017 RepID=UPI000953983F|nr:hypothetical protein [Pseudomonas sp. 7SR1]ROO33430.1 hypothetical protein BIV09_23900 [Pseudomonas sp. 7SR1]SIS23059.1 hypothetical protein SAMN05428955_3404 [Pseudomonas sp. 7SR1]